MQIKTEKRLTSEKIIILKISRFAKNNFEKIDFQKKFKKIFKFLYVSIKTEKRLNSEKIII